MPAEQKTGGQTLSPKTALEGALGTASELIYGPKGKLSEITGILSGEIERRGLARTPFQEVSPGSGRTINKLGVPVEIRVMKFRDLANPAITDLLVGQDGKISHSLPTPGYPYNRVYMPIDFYLEHTPSVLEQFDWLEREQERLGREAAEAKISVSTYRDPFNVLR